MSNFSYYSMPTSGETYKLVLYKRKPNSTYEWEEIPACEFKGRPANNHEIKTFRIMNGVNGNTDSVYVFCSRLPENIKPEDKVFFMGKEWTIESVGYYYENARFVDASIMDTEYLEKVCPKGLALQ